MYLQTSISPKTQPIAAYCPTVCYTMARDVINACVAEKDAGFDKKKLKDIVTQLWEFKFKKFMLNLYLGIKKYRKLIIMFN